MTELIGILSALVAVFAVYITVKKNTADDIKTRIDKERETERRLTSIEQQLARMNPVNDRVVILETKMGLLWSLIEETMPKFLHNPWTQEEQNAIDTYSVEKSKTPTPVLHLLKKAIERKLVEEQLDQSDTTTFVAVLGAIKAQLIDRGEEY